MSESKFKHPIKNRKSLYYRPKGESRATKRRMTAIKMPIFIPEKRYTALYHKAVKECPTSAPVHDILELLLEYYLENEFVLNRKLIPVEDDTVHFATERKRKRTYKWFMDPPPEKQVKVWLLLTRSEDRKFAAKMRREGVTKGYIMNLLVEYYLKNSFIIRTSIIRINRYRTGNPKKDVRLFDNRKREKRYIQKYHDNFI